MFNFQIVTSGTRAVSQFLETITYENHNGQLYERTPNRRADCFSAAMSVILIADWIFFGMRLAEREVSPYAEIAIWPARLIVTLFAFSIRFHEPRLTATSQMCTMGSTAAKAALQWLGFPGLGHYAANAIMLGEITSRVTFLRFV